MSARMSVWLSDDFIMIRLYCTWQVTFEMYGIHLLEVV